MTDKTPAQLVTTLRHYKQRLFDMPAHDNVLSFELRARMHKAFSDAADMIDELTTPTPKAAHPETGEPAKVSSITRDVCTTIAADACAALKSLREIAGTPPGERMARSPIVVALESMESLADIVADLVTKVEHPVASIEIPGMSGEDLKKLERGMRDMSRYPLFVCDFPSALRGRYPEMKPGDEADAYSPTEDDEARLRAKFPGAKRIDPNSPEALHRGVTFAGWDWTVADQAWASKMSWCLTQFDDGQIVIDHDPDSEKPFDGDVAAHILGAVTGNRLGYTDAELDLMSRAVRICDLSLDAVRGQRLRIALEDERNRGVKEVLRLIMEGSYLPDQSEIDREAVRDGEHGLEA